MRWPAIFADTGVTILVTLNALRLLCWAKSNLQIAVMELICNAGVGPMMYDGMSGMMMVGMGILCLLVVVFLILGVAALIKYLFLGRGPDGRRKDGEAS